MSVAANLIMFTCKKLRLKINQRGDRGMTMKLILSFVGLACAVIAALSIPLAICFGVYEWAVIDVEFKVALWGTVKAWLSALAFAVPAVICIALAK